jgi:hypothetical protein
MLEAPKAIGPVAVAVAEASISSRSSSRAPGLDRRALWGVFALIGAAIVSTAAAV